MREASDVITIGWRSGQRPATTGRGGKGIKPEDGNGGPRYWPGLDGLRGLAILLVFGFHLPIPIFPSGSYGVVIFFVLSGFLITTVLLDEESRSGRINLRRFYGRRARRLLPALFLVVVAHLIVQITVLHEPGQWWGRTWPVLGYVSNFAAIAGTNLMHMAHTWSLAIEEHFYLLWPVAIILIPRRQRWRAVMGLTVLLITWRLGLLAAGASNGRIYFGTDTNAFAPLLGCALAIRNRERGLGPASSAVSNLSGIGLILAATIPLHFDDRRLLWGTFAVAFISVFAIHAAISATASIWQHPMLRWFGRISYGLYLWHYMLIALPWDRWAIPPLVGMVAAPIIMAWVSWTFVEAPIMRSTQHGAARLKQATTPTLATSRKAPAYATSEA